MKKGKITVLIIPHGRRAVRELKVSVGLITTLTFLFFIGLVATGYLGSRYIEYRKNLVALAELEEAHRTQGESLYALAEKVSYFEKRIAELNNFDREIRIISNLEVAGGEENFFGVGGSSPEEDEAVERLLETQQVLIDEINRDIDQLLEESLAQERSFRELVEYLKTQKSVLARTPSIWPVVGWVTSEYGKRKSPFTDRTEFHNGIDIAAPHGRNVMAPADGVVKVVKNDRHMGKLIWIDHGDEVMTCYGHLRTQSVKAGQQVKRGEVIGTVGSTGRSTGPHLHYGVQVSGEYVNPRRYLF
ncbi:MAG: M23 family metallopeptidase [Syntrophales bacterium]|nr:M23 family metallopeptidase [Syntrophales bacterium]MCK9528664.1 M23 family metallopeptidase [Syntrophales bacterium]MDX9922030.1 M23 family metallopeptidase [Syntrophales bacterium]